MTLRDFFKENKHEGYDYESAKDVTELFLIYVIDQVKANEPNAVVSIKNLETALNEVQTLVPYEGEY